MNKRYDIIVIGGGPIGAITARYAAEGGVRVLLVERKDRGGESENCTGLVSPRALAVLGASQRSLLRQITGGYLHSPSGIEISIAAPETKALVLNRHILTCELIDRAAAAGVDIRIHTEASRYEGGIIELTTQNGITDKVQASLIIGADGPRSAVARWFSLPSPPKMLVAAQAIIDRTPRREDFVEILFGKDVAPGFFAWAVPAEAGRMRVGLAAPAGISAQNLLDRLLQDRRFSGTLVAKTNGLIPIGTVDRTCTTGALLVGDAAGQTKPTSGGGLYFGGLCARIAGEVGAQAVLSGDLSFAALRSYERRWRKEIGVDHKFGMVAHHTLARLSDDDIDRIFTVINRPAVKDLIEQEGDIDYPRHLAKAFLQRPALWLQLAALISPLGSWEKILTGK
ncbi:geranylgeranyl reductase family protein [Candidatus Acetothermia bacterium]|nr:geranylgeranyl reductase family protein [Candidatus Acetothermia bacterium]